MRRKLIMVLAVGCLVALAGCSGAFMDDKPTLEDTSYPDGVSDTGTNVSALAESHSDGLENQSFTLRIELNQNGSERNESATVRAAVGADRDRVNATVVQDEGGQSTYLTAEKRYVRSVTDGETSYRVSDRSPEAAQFVTATYSGATYLESFAGGVNANFTPTGVTVENGTTLIELAADGSNVSTSDAEVTDYEATMLVDEQGVVHQFDVSVQTESENGERSISLSMTLSDVGETTVEEPSWLDEAQNQTAE